MRAISPPNPALLVTNGDRMALSAIRALPTAAVAKARFSEKKALVVSRPHGAIEVPSRPAVRETDSRRRISRICYFTLPTNWASLFHGIATLLRRGRR